MMALRALPELQDHRAFRVPKEPRELLVCKDHKAARVLLVYRVLPEPLARLDHRVQQVLRAYRGQRAHRAARAYRDQPERRA